jgi:hypothetical protein
VELRWLFGESEGALGMRAAPLDRSGLEPDYAELADKRSRAVARYVDATRRLGAVGASEGRVLRVAFTPHRWPPELVALRLYEAGPVAALLLDRERRADAERRREKLLGRLAVVGPGAVVNGHRVELAAELQKSREVLLEDVIAASKTIGHLGTEARTAIVKRAKDTLRDALFAFATA